METTYFAKKVKLTAEIVAADGEAAIKAEATLSLGGFTYIYKFLKKNNKALEQLFSGKICREYLSNKFFQPNLTFNQK